MLKAPAFRATGIGTDQTPLELGYAFPAEFDRHASTWLSWPHKEASWPGKIETVYAPYAEFIRLVSEGERVNINVADAAMESSARAVLANAGVSFGTGKDSGVYFHHHPTNDAWCRDHGPAFLVNDQAERRRIIVDWGYNAWGGKYPPFDLDDVIPTRVARYLGMPVIYPDIVMEGGSVEFNGAGTVLTTTSCLLNPNRNPQFDQQAIEQYLLHFYGMEQVLWLGDGIVGDDTDGHIDDITRFINSDTVVTAVEPDRTDDNHHLLRENLESLKKMKLHDGRSLNIIELPMPGPVVYEDQRLPASYANFYISNSYVVVPTFRHANDDKALKILEGCFPGRRVVGVDSWDVIWGLGSWHCLSQQEPV